MSFFRGDVYSYALDKMTPLNIYLPHDDNRRFRVDKPQRTLILLHGLEGNHSYWNRYTSVERYAQRRNLALIMPEAEMSMYSDMKCVFNMDNILERSFRSLSLKCFELIQIENIYRLPAYQWEDMVQ